MIEVVDGEIYTPSDVHPEVIDKYDIVGLGSGIYFGKHHKSLFKLLDRVNFRNKRVFIFYTSGFSKVPLLNSCEGPLKRALEVRGAKILGVFGCRGYCDHGLFKLVGGINKNRPDESDLNRAKNFVIKVLKQSE